MKVYLMYKDRDFDLEQNAPWNGPELIQDLQLAPISSAMANDDEFLHRVAQSALLSGFGNGPDVIFYRQAVLRDCLKNPFVVKRLYELAVSVIGDRKVSHWAAGLANSPWSILFRAVESLQVFLGTLKTLKSVADQDAGKFESEGFKEFFARIKGEISSEYLEEIEGHLWELSLRDEVLIGAQLGKGNRGSNYVLLKSNNQKKWIQRVFSRGPRAYTFRINDQDETAIRKLGELRNRGINSVANATAQSVDHVLNFLVTLQTELAFYLGCVNLHERLAELGEPTCFPVVAAVGERIFSSEGLYDISLALSMGQQVVANDINADSKSLIIVTGANKGGKTTFLRSVGLSQMMMHCGMFVPARSFCANLCTGLFTHFKRKEDVSMESGKLDDELSRMSQIADHLSAHSLVLLNETFAATNEIEGSEIARQIVAAMIERQVKVIFVSHLYQFAHELYEARTNEALFLRAERKTDGTRTYRLTNGEPLDTSYGVDLYNRIFVGGGPEIYAKVQ
ncbi:MAG: DNA mismatch repair protein MutS [Chloroflexi bacterium]|nr:DNA mismatch repair protein MutS [Chloroflexota bacterium]